LGLPWKYSSDLLQNPRFKPIMIGGINIHYRISQIAQLFHSFQRLITFNITSGKLIVYERGMVGEQRKHKDNFEKFPFHPQKLFFLKISGNSQHQNASTRNKPQHQMVSTRNKPIHQNMYTGNKPKHHNSSTGTNHILVLRFVPG
jgi:hypothetical protein